MIIGSHKQTLLVRQSRAGFTLIELIVVIGVMAVLMTLSMPSISSMRGGMILERKVQEVAGIIMQARENAISKNRRVDVRLIRAISPGGRSSYWAVQPWISQNDSGLMVPLMAAVTLPDTVTLAANEKLSPLLTSGTANGGVMRLLGNECTYVGFSFRPNGASTLATDGILTVVSQGDVNATETNLPRNFRSIHINHLTGKVTIFGP